MPVKYIRYVENSTFNLTDSTKKDYGKIKQAPSSKYSFIGAPKALTRLGVEPGDTVKFAFDLTNKEVIVEIVLEDVLEDELTDIQTRDQQNHDEGYNLEDDPIYRSLWEDD